jgi:hypothetical protein
MTIEQPSGREALRSKAELLSKKQPHAAMPGCMADRMLRGSADDRRLFRLAWMEQATQARVDRRHVGFIPPDAN